MRDRSVASRASMSRMQLVLQICNSICILGACASDPVTAVDEIESVVRTTCARAFACRDTYPNTDFALVYGESEAECVALGTRDADVAVAFDASVADGRIEIDREAIASCKASIVSLGCDAFWDAPVPAACRETSHGTVPQNGNCTLAEDDIGRLVDVGDCVEGFHCTISHSCE